MHVGNQIFFFSEERDSRPAPSEFETAARGEMRRLLAFRLLKVANPRKGKWGNFQGVLIIRIDFQIVPKC